MKEATVLLIIFAIAAWFAVFPMLTPEPPAYPPCFPGMVNYLEENGIDPNDVEIPIFPGVNCT